VLSPHFPDPRPNPGPMPVPVKADYEESIDLLGRTFTVGVYGKDPTYARLAAQEAVRRLERIADMVDPARADSELATINREGADRPFLLSEEMFHLLSRAMEISEKSKGALDLTAGPLRDLWRAYGDRGQTPPPSELAEARALVGMQYIQVDPKKRVIRLKKKGVTIDLRDVIGGFAADQAVYALRQEKVVSGYVHVGELWRLMQHPLAENEQMWTMGIPDTNPNNAGRASRTFSIPSGAVVSKGYYTGYRFVGNMPISDMVDPRSGNPAGGVAVCTVVGPDGLSVDAIASALVVLGGNQADYFLKQLNPKEPEIKSKKFTPEE